MLVFRADSAIALELIALAFGVFLVVWFRMHSEHVKKPCNFLAYLIVVLSLLTLLCTGYYSTKYWIYGYFGKPMYMKYQKMKDVDSKDMMRFKWWDKKDQKSKQ